MEGVNRLCLDNTGGKRNQACASERAAKATEDTSGNAECSKEADEGGGSDVDGVAEAELLLVVGDDGCVVGLDDLLVVGSDDLLVVGGDDLLVVGQPLGELLLVGQPLGELLLVGQPLGELLLVGQAGGEVPPGKARAAATRVAKAKTD
ncbi:MAG: hypothetical protein M1821_003686 [Bathelium mastoideum]|nr:MAG: hypothetical protein M1821_003686 [Bathelium mastoideum]